MKFLLPVIQWQFWHLGWHFWLFTLQRHPPLVSPGPLDANKTCYLAFEWHQKTVNQDCVKCHELLTRGPHRGPLVTQQISVWQTVQRSQSHPSLFCTMMPHLGQCIASPDCTSVCDSVTLKQGFASESVLLFWNTPAVVILSGSVCLSSPPWGGWSSSWLQSHL